MAVPAWRLLWPSTRITLPPMRRQAPVVVSTSMSQLCGPVSRKPARPDRGATRVGEQQAQRQSAFRQLDGYDNSASCNIRAPG